MHIPEQMEQNITDYILKYILMNESSTILFQGI